MEHDVSHPTGKIEHHICANGGTLTTVTGPRGHVVIRSQGRYSLYYLTWGARYDPRTIGNARTRRDAIAMACEYAGIEV